MNWAMAEKLESPNDLRIVLNWGAEPHDLDSKLKWESNGREFAVNYNNKRAKCGGCTVTLDRDTTEGWGPQTLTLANFDELPNDVDYVDFIGTHISFLTAEVKSLVKRNFRYLFQMIFQKK